ncbi:MAG TPA: hypothetical protein VFZ65_19510 [Planctomycetota bacterium]|nr:hypothetical protein [Planctomycetota bacterium]
MTFALAPPFALTVLLSGPAGTGWARPIQASRGSRNAHGTRRR